LNAAHALYHLVQGVLFVPFVVKKWAVAGKKPLTASVSAAKMSRCCAAMSFGHALVSASVSIIGD
jgi:hypothetical protein